MKSVLTSQKGILAVGIIIGLIAVVLQKYGNPANMGVCVTCFCRDIAGALGLHRAAVVQYLRPEIMGFVLGSMVAAFVCKEFKPRAGSAPVVRFDLGFFAMIGAVCATGNFLGTGAPECAIGGDIGTRDGSRQVYRYLIKNLPKSEAGTLCLHYIIPEIGLHNQVLTAVRKMKTKPLVIADAGFMYVAKASGQAPFYDLFLPDIGELAFLADEKAAHPAYTRGFLTRLEVDPGELIKKTFAFGSGAANLCVKGRIDYICSGGAVLDIIAEPVIEALEPIGGTGDTITGMASALAHHGFSIPEACAAACRANRIAGLLARPTPATQIHEIIAKIPAALAGVFGGEPAVSKSEIFSGVMKNAV